MTDTRRSAPELPGYRDGRLHSIADRPITLFTDFDVDAYARNARGRIKVAKPKVKSIPAGVRDDLAFLWRLDSAALSETRALLASWSGNEARITAFIATWAYERLWLAHAVRDLLTADGSDLPEPLGRDSLFAKARNYYVEHALPIFVPVWTSVAGESVTAGHMARLAVQEASLQAAYAALLPRLGGEGRRVVQEIVDRRDEMIRFFRMEASARISRSPQEARMAKLHLLQTWRPFRVVGAPDPDEERALASIFRTPLDRLRLADADAGLRRLLMERPTGFWGAATPTPGLLSRKDHSGVRS
ncbi:hypothetical protein SAMN02745244_01058 [Tessaracoccus bendigoensis DSM 12906]|uniref:Uncharacterized protein n=1 Tax=Tessaracoccus bendigoensis DSM 12906 TaxID=1123357 RepID=A0A1M6E0K2_9ACTN|nr:hypothetical protein [Tessaracoccus bendigoensis]SHI78981.1 hypothetical protein SAMN02745244_01058 [Tessaracoccus bendigoensis DSM 12906]